MVRNKRKKNIILIIFLVLSFIVTLSACDKDKKSLDGLDGIIEDKGPVRGGTIKLFSTIPDTLNPIFTKNSHVKNFSSLVYEPLIKLDSNQKCVPVLSDKWTVSEDLLTWTFHIRENVFWHDNVPLTAEDVNFTFQIITDVNLQSIYKENLKNVISFSVVDKNNFAVVLKQIDSFTPELMVFPILPKHYFDGENMSITPKNMSPLGTGAYKFVVYNQGNTIEFTRNEKWWNAKNKDSKLPDLPYVDNIVVNIGNNSSEGAKRFQTRDIDILSLEYGDSSKYSARRDLIFQKYPSKKFDYLALNLKSSFLWSKAVRQAIACAINIDGIISKTLGGNAIASDFPVIPDTWLNKSDTVAYDYNIENAKKILNQDGWTEIQGIMYKNIYGVSRPLKLQLAVNDDNKTRVKVANDIKNNLKDVGIDVEIKLMSWEEEMNIVSKKWYDMALMGVEITSIPEISFMYSTYGGFNSAGYSNQTVDNLLEQIKKEANSATKEEFFKKMKEIITDDVPYVGLYFYHNAVVYNNRIRGEMSPNFWNVYNDINRWYLP